MKIQDLLLEMNYIDEKYIEECDAVPEKKKTSFRRVRFALIAAVVTVLLAVTAFAAYELTLTKVGDKSKEYRLIEVREKYDEIDLSKSGVTYFPDNVKLSDFKIGYIPEGFERVSVLEREQERDCLYYNTKSDSNLTIQIVKSGSNSVFVDNENSKLYKIDNQGYTGYLIYNEEKQFGSLIYGDKNLIVIIAGIISKEELIKISKSIVY